MSERAHWGTALTLAQLKLVHEALAEGKPQEAAMLALFGLGEQRVVETASEAFTILRSLFDEMYDAGNSLGCCVLCLPELFFNPHPKNVLVVLQSIRQHNQLLICGGSSQSKTYSGVVEFYLAWLRDPEFTSVKLMSQSEAHLKENMWSHLMEIHERNILKPEAEVHIRETDLWMGIKGRPMSYGFSGIAFKQSQVNTSAFSGFKPQPKRPANHPSFTKFGPMTRLRVLLDEAHEISEGVWTGLNSIMGSISGERVKIAAAFNPTRMDSSVIRRAEPPDGWRVDQIDTLYEWKSKQGWQVVRLDPAQSENVQQRKEVFDGLMTYDRYMAYLSSGGDNSPSYLTYARGFPPLQDAANTIIPPDWVNTQRGEAIYIGPVTNVGSADLAYQGQDKAVLCTGRWGLASGWRDQHGKVHPFQDRLNPGKIKPRHVLTIDQFITLSKKLDPIAVTQEIMGKCKLLGVKAEWLAMDCTGNAMATFSYVAKYWGAVLGLNWAHHATDSKILSDDADTCHNRFDGSPSEMWFAFKEWLNPAVNAVLFNPTIASADIYTELTTRRFIFARGNRLKVEAKDAYKARNGGKSPDLADVAIMLVALVRARGGIIPGVIEETGGRREAGPDDDKKVVKPVAHHFHKDLPEDGEGLEVVAEVSLSGSSNDALE